MNRADKLAILIIDDQFEVLEVYQDILGSQLGHQVECVSMPGEAVRHIKNQLFDVVIIDAKITYKGAEMGGLILAEEVGLILGVNSVILMSQYDVREDVRHFNPSYTFLPKPRNESNIVAWVQKELIGKIRTLIDRQYGFVAMPFNDTASDDCYHGRLAPWMREAGFEIKRMDEIPTTRPINHELLERIKQAHFVIFYASKQNANVFFEAGYAHGIEKYVVVVSPDFEELPFDIRSNFILSIGKSEEQVERTRLLTFMSGLRGLRGHA